MPSSGFEWSTSPEQAFGAGMDAYAATIRSVVLQLCQARAPEIEAWMKQNAPWQDHTGNARQGLHAFAEAMGQSVVITMSHGMHYGIYLETKGTGSWGILAPAIDHWGPIIMQDLIALVGAR